MNVPERTRQINSDITKTELNKFIRNTLIPAIKEAAGDGVKLKVNGRGIDYTFLVLFVSMLVGAIGALAILVMMR